MEEKNVNHGVDLPMDLINLILLSSPARTLLRFRCVCNEWYNSIHNPTFISDYNIAHYNDPINYLIHKRSWTKSVPAKKCLFRWNKLLPFGNDLDEVLDFEFPLTLYQLKFHGSCNGLVCFSVTRSSSSHPVIYLWNPSIKKYKMIDHDYNNHGMVVKSVMGIRLCRSDNDIDDYKILKYSYGEKVNDPEDDCNFLDVFTFSTNSWKRIMVDVGTCVFFNWGSSNPVNGAMHWVGTSQDDYCILSFHLQRETFGEIPLPKVDSFSRLMFEESHWCLGDISDSLCLLSHSGSKMFVWIMKEYGMVESWTILKTIDIESDIGAPILLGNQGFMVHWSNENISMFDFEDKKWIQIEDNNSPEKEILYSATDYNESLVLLNEK